MRRRLAGARAAALERVLEPRPARPGSIEVGGVDDGDAALPRELEQLAVVGENRRRCAERLGQDGRVQTHRHDQRRLAEDRGDARHVDGPRHEIDGLALAHARRDGAVQRVVVLGVVLLEGQERDPQPARGKRVERPGKLLEARFGHREPAERVRVAAQADEHVRGRPRRRVRPGAAFVREQAGQRQHDVASEPGFGRTSRGEGDVVGAAIAHHHLAGPLEHVAQDARAISRRRRSDPGVEHVPRGAERLGDEVLLGGERQVAPAAIVAQDVAAAADQPVEAAQLLQQPERGAAAPGVVPRPLPEQRHVAQRRQRAGALALFGSLGEHGHARVYWIHPPDEAAQHELIAQIADPVEACQQ